MFKCCVHRGVAVMFLGPGKTVWLAMNFYANDVSNVRIKARMILACTLMAIARFSVDSSSVGGMQMCKCWLEYW